MRLTLVGTPYDIETCPLCAALIEVHGMSEHKEWHKRLAMKEEEA